MRSGIEESLRISEEVPRQAPPKTPDYHTKQFLGTIRIFEEPSGRQEESRGAKVRFSDRHDAEVQHAWNDLSGRQEGTVARALSTRAICRLFTEHLLGTASAAS